MVDLVTPILVIVNIDFCVVSHLVHGVLDLMLILVGHRLGFHLVLRHLVFPIRTSFSDGRLDSSLTRRA